MALLITALLIVVVLWPSRQPTEMSVGRVDSKSSLSDVDDAVACVNPELEDRREIIRNSVARVESLVDRYHQRRRIQYESMELRSRITALERALEMGASRAVVIGTIQESLHEAMQLNKISTSGSHWKLAGHAPSDAVLDSVVKTIQGRIDTSVPSVRYVAKKEGLGRFYVEYLSPQPKAGLPEARPADLAALPDLPDRTDVEADCWNPLEAEELSWRLAEARVAGMLGDRTLIEDTQEKQLLEERLAKLKSGLMRDPNAAQAEGRGDVVLEVLEQSSSQGSVTPTGVRRFNGVTTQAYRVSGQGELSDALSAVRIISNAGALIGRVEICRLGANCHPRRC